MNQKENLKNGKTINFSFLTLLICFFIASTSKVIAQKNSISGKVIDKHGLSLPGASIIIKGTSIGVETDFEGNYTIKAEPKNTLIFNYLGFITKEIIVENKKTIDITLLEDAATLDEVVVVGYGTQKKSDVTGAVGQVKAEELTRVVTTNPIDALQGRVSGVTVTSSSGSPGSGADISIRGIGTFGQNQPLYIIDGVQADPYFIDATNIASMEILKDAASGAIYGTKAANGVVLITTKKGKKGKSKIEIETSLSINTARKKLKLLDANGYVSVHKQMYENAGKSLPSYVTAPITANTDWLDETHRNGELSLLNVRMSGASDNFNYSAGASYADETGMLIGSIFTKKGVYANIGFTKDRFKVNTSLNYSETYREQQKFSLRETFQISPLIPVFDETKESGFGYRDGSLPDHKNPVGEDHFKNDYTKLKYFLGSVNVSYDLLDNLTAKVNYSVSNLTNYTYDFHQAFQVRAVPSNPENEFAFISEYNNEFRRINQEYTLNYSLEFGKSNFNFLAGYQRISEPLKETYAQAEGWKYSPKDLNNNGDLDDKIPAIILDPSFNTLNAFRDGTRSATGTNYEYSLVSQFGRVNYSFDDKYLFQASIRRDGSSKFGKNNKYGTFPSVALGWKITEENFI
ncbi:SusC/RagA family TonB-linked outer membrane protein [Tenacibaculum pacificus]|uniref:SusC/RagA family TonB-linked outer membrane protein n=1 Tax=Tenacibaculum pacificus TaxID=3018314 RepID=UPI0022F3A5A8|nr:SusC/RagA family TonB-linked outer membrane protein [Tenacibaculum pacificus]WBX74064.1 SusC/RagA family TonB-linked outer membrane protein [Tenacibaculum pacificus]